MGSIIDVIEGWDESGGWSHDGKDGKSVSSRVFTVLVDNTGGIIHENDILNHGDIPQPRAAHPYSPFMRCNGVNAVRRNSSAILWDVTATYELGVIITGDPNPLNKPAVRNWFTIHSEAEVDEDSDGNPLVTVNNEPITGITRPFSDLGLRVVKNVATWNPLSIYLFIDNVNSDQFYNFPVGTVKFHDIKADEINEDDFSYYTVTAEFHFQAQRRMSSPARAWWTRFRHEGYLVRGAERDAATEATHALDAAGDKVSKPVLLKEDGTQETDPEKAIWLERPMLYSKPFNGLGLS